VDATLIRQYRGTAGPGYDLILVPRNDSRKYSRTRGITALVTPSLGISAGQKIVVVTAPAVFPPLPA